MFKQVPNEYELFEDYAVGTTGTGEKYIIDIDDYEKVKQWTCYHQRGHIYLHIGKKTVSLAKFILGIEDKKRKIQFIDGNGLNVRKSNIFSWNTYEFCGDYVVGTCSDGQTYKIDAEDYGIVSKYFWHVDGNDYLLTRVGNSAIKMHRLVMGVLDKPEIEVDHIHHDTHDNRKSQLRLVDRSVNCYNRRITDRNSSGTAGVYWSKPAQKWCAQINKLGKRVYLGSYSKIEDAVAVRRSAEQNLFGFSVS